MTPYSLSGVSGTSIFLLALFNDATNLSEALGITTSDGRSRAKELFRIGLLTHELTKGMAALNSAKNGENLQTRFGFIVALIYQAYEKKQTGNLLRAVAAINSIFSLIQPFEMNGLSVATNTIVQKLLEVFRYLMVMKGQLG